MVHAISVIQQYKKLLEKSSNASNYSDLESQYMTMPVERARSVVQAREFLQELMHSTDVPESVRREARRLLRHYPSDGDLRLAASALPGWWANPDDERTT
jgi:hypothetical protein